MNHSNTVYLLNDLSINSMDQAVDREAEKENEPGSVPQTDNLLVGFASGSFEYELTKTSGSINVEGLPVYDGTTIESTGYGEKDLLLDSPISGDEFYKKWYDLCGCEVNGSAVVLSRGFITDALAVLIPVIISIEADYNSKTLNLDIKQISQLMAKENELYTDKVLQTIIHKFGDVDESSGKFRLENLVITRWFGIQALSKEGRALDCKEFLLHWKSSLPHFYNVPLDLAQLKGFYVKPTSTLVQYLDPTSFSLTDAGVRIKELLLVSKEWDLEDFLPFIEDLVPSGRKPDSIILKHAKKKRVGKNRFVVCPR